MSTGQQGLFGDASDEPQARAAAATPPFTLEERVRYEKEYLGAYFSGHPLNNYEQLIASCRAAMLNTLSTWELQRSI